MSLISLQAVDYSVGGPLLLERVDLTIEANERVALIGRNGAGKSTLLRLLAGDLVPDDGEVRRQGGVRIARLEQEVPAGTDGEVFGVVAAGLGEVGAWLGRYHELSHALPVDTAALAEVQARIEAAHGWSADQRVAETLARLGLDGEARFDALSGGMKRRVLLARALVCAPDLLLLDEPTNHLDIEAIDWLEGFLRSYQGSVVFVTHDRRFLRALATRIVEIDRGGLTSWPGDWANYVRRRDERLNAESKENARFDKLLAQEEAWIRQGVKARRTRDEGRVRRLQAMRRERAQRRQETGNVRMALAQSGSSGRKVIEARGLCFAHGDQVLVRDFDTIILRGDRIGLVGANGSGKTTLIRLLLGQLQPDAGEVILGSQLQVAYFDQHRAALREDWNALDNVAEGQEFIDVGGRRTHVLGYLQDFLFAPDRARAPITRLSGGERNRLLLAKLFAQPANLLVLDEPTNDLDVETLELLEERLMDFPGTLLLVSHDRDFLDNVVTSTLVMEGDGRIGDYVGGYSDWLRQRLEIDVGDAGGGDRSDADPAHPAIASAAATAPVAAPARARKLSFKDSQELAQLPARIEQIEGRLAELAAAMATPAFYQGDAAAIAAGHAELASLHTQLEQAYARWQVLEG